MQNERDGERKERERRERKQRKRERESVVHKNENNIEGKTVDDVKKVKLLGLKTCD